MTITPEIAELVRKLVDYHAEWAWAATAPTERPGVVTSLDEISTIALDGLKETLKELYWALPRLCPYCGAEMETREVHPDQLGYSTADYNCRCGAAVNVAHFPPEEGTE